MLAYVEKIVINEIPSEHVIAAIPVDREVKIYKKEFTQGTCHLVDEIEYNDDCDLPEDIQDQVKKFLLGELAHQNKAAATNTESKSSELIKPEEGYSVGPKID